jgi:hypothetical protein
LPLYPVQIKCKFLFETCQVILLDFGNWKKWEVFPLSEWVTAANHQVSNFSAISWWEKLHSMRW